MTTGRHVARNLEPGWQAMLAAAATLFAEISRAQDELETYVLDARDAGATWQAVGEALGMAPVEARELFGPVRGLITPALVLRSK